MEYRHPREILTNDAVLQAVAELFPDRGVLVQVSHMGEILRFEMWEGTELDFERACAHLRLRFPGAMP
jgi:hypothetical protein